MTVELQTEGTIHRLNVAILEKTTNQHYFPREMQTAKETFVQKLKGDGDTCKNFIEKVTIVLVSYTVYYAQFINLLAYPGHDKCDVCLLRNTAFCAYFSDKSNFLAMFLAVRPTKKLRD